MMFGRAVVLAAVLLSSVSIGVLEAQTLATGDRVRATLKAGSGRWTGTLVEWVGDTLYLAPNGSAEGVTATAIPLATLSRLEVSTGFRSNAGKGALIGGGIGLLVGGGMSIIAGSTVDTEVTSSDYVAFTGLVTLGGAGLGALIGSLSKSERWKEYPVDGLRLGIAPGSDGGFQLTAVLRFR